MIKLNFNKGVWRVHLPNGVIHVTSNIETAFAVIRDYAALTGKNIQCSSCGDAARTRVRPLPDLGR